MFAPRFQITAAIARSLMRIEAIHHELDSLPLRASLLRSLRETALLVSTHYSTQIEGNRLTLPEVESAIGGERIPGRERDEAEVRNHFRAFEHMERLAARRNPLVQRDIQTLHGLVMRGRNLPSPYRTQQNVIRDSVSGRIVYLPPEAKDVSRLMAELAAWVNRESGGENLPAPVVAALAHYQFATIHPYLDGNGRTARLLATLILRRSGYGLRGIYSLDEYYAKDLAGYYGALSIGSHNYYEGRVEADVTRFVAYFCAGMAEAFRRIRLVALREAKTSKGADRSAVLRRLDPRQRQLLGLFQSQGSATSAEMAAALKMSPRTLVSLCREWIASGFLELHNPSRKARSYRLSKRMAAMLGSHDGTRPARQRR